MNWEQLFAVHMSVAEILVRGSAIYWFLFLMFRFVLRRDGGSVGLADLLLLVIIADAAQSALAGDYKTITEGMILIATLCGWNVLLDRLAYRFKLVDEFMTPKTLLLIRHGRMVTRNMARELITREDLMMKLRQSGIATLADVRHAYLESDGEISVIKERRARGNAARAKPSKGAG